MPSRAARPSAARRLLRRSGGAAALVLLGGCAASPGPTASPAPAAAAEYRIYDSEGRPLAGLGALVDALRGADVVFVGEQHDDPVAHRFEHELLQALARRDRPVAVGLEMFERDAQPALDAYLAGTLPEPALLQLARPWPNYATDYRPLVEWARQQGWPVVATNAPRPLAAAVAQGGLDALQTLPPAHRGFAAADVRCPEDAYFQRFAREMQHHPGPSGSAPALPEMQRMIARLYEAQCVKDETMAESIVRARQGDRLVVHFNGAFHSDFGHGIVSRLQRRDPGVRTAVISVVPAADARDPAAVAPHRGRADFLVLTPPVAEPEPSSR